MRKIRIILIDVHVHTLKTCRIWKILKSSKSRKFWDRSIIGIRVKLLPIVYPIQHFCNTLFSDHYEIHWLNNQLQIRISSIIHDFVASFAIIAPSIIANNQRFMPSLHLQLSSGIYNLVYRSHPIVHLLYLFLPLYFPLYFILQFSQCNSFSVLM